MRCALCCTPTVCCSLFFCLPSVLTALAQSAPTCDFGVSFENQEVAPRKPYFCCCTAAPFLFCTSAQPPTGASSMRHLRQLPLQPAYSCLLIPDSTPQFTRQLERAQVAQLQLKQDLAGQQVQAQLRIAQVGETAHRDIAQLTQSRDMLMATCSHLANNVRQALEAAEGIAGQCLTYVPYLWALPGGVTCVPYLWAFNTPSGVPKVLLGITVQRWMLRPAR